MIRRGSTKKMKELKSLKDDCQVYSHLEELMDDIATYIELAEEENDPGDASGDWRRSLPILTLPWTISV